MFQRLMSSQGPLDPWVASDLPDEGDARRARLLNLFALFMTFGAAVVSLVGLASWIANIGARAGTWFVSGGLATGLMLVAYLLSRRGQLRIAIPLFLGTLAAIIIALLLAFGSCSLAAIFIPIFVLSTAMLTRRWFVLPAAIIAELIYLGVALAEQKGYWHPFLMVSMQDLFSELLIIGHLLGISLFAILARLSAGNLLEAIDSARLNLTRAAGREEELKQVRSRLEHQIRERTRDLEDMLSEMQQQMQEQQSLLDVLRRQAIPVIPLLHQIVAVPVVGVLDAQRADQLLTGLLDGIQQYDARFALLDITGSPIIDQAAAQGVARAVQGARMVGAECVLVGVNPDIASKLVDLELDLGEIVSHVDMEAGIRYALQRMHYQLSRSTTH